MICCKSNQFQKYLFHQIYYLMERKVFMVYILLLMCVKSFAFENSPTTTHTLFISENVVVVGLENDDNCISNKKSNIYLLPNTTFVASKQLYANVITIESKNKLVETGKLTKLKLTNHKIHQNKKTNKCNSNLLQIKSIPFNGSHSDLYFSIFQNNSLLPTETNPYKISFFIEKSILFNTNLVVLIYKDQKFVYQQLIKNFALNIPLLNKPPPVL